MTTKIKSTEKISDDLTKLKTCGIVMPISEMDGCSQHHWQDVLDIIEKAGYEPNLVSNADEVSFINKRIVQNLYENPIVICDVSGKNPNVMFELGMRLAFDKPTIIVKDDKTNYAFDIASIEHIPYPRDLRFAKIIEFKKHLSEKIVATIKASEDDPQFTTFLKHFGQFKVPKLDSKEVSSEEFILDELKAMRQSLTELSRENRSINRPSGLSNRSYGDLCLRKVSVPETETILETIASHPDVFSAALREVSLGHHHVRFELKHPSIRRARELEHLFRGVLKIDEGKHI